MRMALYVKRSEEIQQHNAEAASGLYSFTMGENFMTDYVSNKLSYNDLLCSKILLISDG